MKSSQPQLLVGLGSKMSRVGDHWAAVNQVLLANYPLVLLAAVERGGFEVLAGRLSELREGVRGAGSLSGVPAPSSLVVKGSATHYAVAAGSDVAAG